MLQKILDDLRSFPADAALVWRLRGAAGVRDEVLSRTVSRVFRWGRLWVLEQDLAAVRELPPPPGVTIEEFLGPWRDLAGIATSREIRVFERAATHGRSCLLARRGDEPIGYTWNSYTIDAAIENYPIPLPEDAAYGWNLFVIPSERGSGTGTALVSARLVRARAHGCRTAWRMIAPSNRPSLRTAEKPSGGGMRRVATLTYVRLGRRMYSRYTPVGPTSDGGPHAG